jgi:hypothetical protein
MKKHEVAKKMICESKKSMVKEHERLVPELRKSGLKKEANKQAKELKEYKKK